MNWRPRLLKYFALITFLLLTVAASLPAKGSDHTHKKRRHGAADYQSVRTIRSRTRTRYAASPRIDNAHRAALIEQISAQLKKPPPDVIAYDSALDGFYAQLQSHEAESKSVQTSTVRILQFGDSHTAADMFTGEARHLFQQQFGDGGIGYSYAGHPFAGYRILGSSHSQSTGWKTQGNKFMQLGDAQLGMGGISISTARAGERITLDAPCSTLDFQYLQQPGGGSLRFRDNGLEVAEIQTDATVAGPGTYHYFCPAGDHHFEVSTEKNAPVTLFGWVAIQPGVTWEAVGINGAEAPLILKWDQLLFSRYLKDSSPALIVLAYGTNEAASSYWDEETYRKSFASIIDTIHEYVPESSILVVGPADRSTSLHRAWHPYAGTDHIIRAQREVCRTHGCAYWDQRERMGGFGSMQQWVYAGLAQPDHTHFTGEGYRQLADALIADLMAGYHTYNKRNTTNQKITEQGAHDGAASPNP